MRNLLTPLTALALLAPLQLAIVSSGCGNDATGPDRPDANTADVTDTALDDAATDTTPTDTSETDAADGESDPPDAPDAPDLDAPDDAPDLDVQADGDAADTTTDPDSDPSTDTGDVGPSDCTLPPTTTERLWPVPGELYYAQIGLGGFGLGESAIVVAPDGTIVLIDAGNDAHDDDIRSALGAITNAMASAGFEARPADHVDHVIITHLHADHSDGLQDLLNDVTVDGRVVHRGFVDLTEAANDATIAQLCDTLVDNPGIDYPLCTAATVASCDPGSWVGTYPAVDCAGLNRGDIMDDTDSGGAFIDLGAAQMGLLAANGFIGDDQYETEVGPFYTDDSNGENARSVVGLLQLGPFELIFSGDLTGGGSDTDPIEGYYASRLGGVSDIGVDGVDVLHASHHGRNTSSSDAWLDRLVPSDGLSRNVVMGISTAHVGSPHQEVLDALFAPNRLSDGFAWTTTVTLGGATNARLMDAGGGWVVVRTHDGGDGYWVQSVAESGAVLRTESFVSIGCE